jgi:serine/threonine protein kinase
MNHWTSEFNGHSSLILLFLLWCRVIKDIETGHVLGSGTFGTVRELKNLKRGSTTSSTAIFNDSLESSLHSVASNYESPSAQTQDTSSASSSLYAVKQLRQDLSSSKRRTGSIDLVVEAQLLTSLCHRNIVSLEGIGENPGSKGFFIIIERLERTLTQEMKAWKNKVDLIKKGYIQSFDKNTTMKNMLQNQLDNRVEHAYDLSSALKYLHDKK